MLYLRALTAFLAAAPGVLAKSKAKVGTSSALVLARSPRAVVAARQGTEDFCGTDANGDDWECTDPDTYCCTGPEVWQCVPLDGECCTTGYYCDPGTHCYLDADDEQLCLTPEEIDEGDDLGGDRTDPPPGAGSGSGSGSAPTTTASAPGATTTAPAGDEPGAGGGRKKKQDDDSAAGRFSAGNVMASVVAVGALALV